MTQDEARLSQLANMIMFRYLRHPEKLPQVIEFRDAKTAEKFMDFVRQIIAERNLPKSTADILEKLVREKKH